MSSATHYGLLVHKVNRDDHQAAIAKLLGPKLQFVIADTYEQTQDIRRKLGHSGGRLTAYAPVTKRRQWERNQFPQNQSLPKYDCHYAVHLVRFGSDENIARGVWLNFLRNSLVFQRDKDMSEHIKERGIQCDMVKALMEHHPYVALTFRSCRWQWIQVCACLHTANPLLISC